MLDFVSPAKGVGRATGARVQIPSSPPKNRIRKPFLGFWVRFFIFSVQGVLGQVLKQSGSQKVVKKQAADPGRLPLKINRFCPCLPLFPLRSYTGMNRYKPGSH